MWLKLAFRVAGISESEKYEGKRCFLLGFQENPYPVNQIPRFRRIYFLFAIFCQAEKRDRLVSASHLNAEQRQFLTMLSAPDQSSLQLLEHLGGRTLLPSYKLSVRRYSNGATNDEPVSEYAAPEHVQNLPPYSIDTTVRNDFIQKMHLARTLFNNSKKARCSSFPQRKIFSESRRGWAIVLELNGYRVCL